MQVLLCGVLNRIWLPTLLSSGYGGAGSRQGGMGSVLLFQGPVRGYCHDIPGLTAVLLL